MISAEPMKSPYNELPCFENKYGLLEYTPQGIGQLNHVYRDIWYRLHNRDQNFLMVITGKPGEGKSYAALRVATQIDPNFDVTRQVVFTPDQFMELARSADLHDGAVIIWEEVGVNYNSKDWFTVINKQIGYIIQTFRKKHICLIMTVPNKDFMDSTVRKLLNAEGKMMGIDRTRKVARMRVYFPHYESNTRKWYFKKPQITIKKTGESFKVSSIFLPKVGVKMAHLYEKLRADFVGTLGEQVQHEIGIVAKGHNKPQKISSIVKQVVENNIKYRSLKGRIDATKIQYKYELSRQKAYDVKKLAEELLGEA